jgi:hypothetical protein
VSALTVAAVVREVGGGVFDVHVVEDHYKTRRQRFAKKWGQGVAVTIRIEPTVEAATWGQFKHLYGHLYAPVSVRTGETVAEVNLRMKASYFPEDGRTSLSELDQDELKAFIESVEQDIRETDPDSWEDCVAAMELYDHNHRRRRTA